MFTMPTTLITPARFKWSGKFTIPAPNHNHLLKYLGVDGSISPDISGESHLYQMELVNSVDVGSLATSNFNFTSSTDTTSTTDANFGDGTRPVNLVGTSFATAGFTTPDGSYPIPNPMDGTKSFLVGGIATIESLPGAHTFGNIVSKFSNSGNGWELQVRDDGSGTDAPYLRFWLFQQSYGTNILIDANANGQGNIVFGEPFAFIFGVDVAAGKQFAMVSNLGSYKDIAWTDGGAYTSTTGMRVGKSNHFAADDSWNGLIGQLFTVEWSDAIDAELSDDNMLNFLKYNDGTLHAWSGKFDVMPQTTTEAAEWLGINGNLTGDLGDISHFWRVKAANASDIGTGTTYNMVGASGNPQYGLDADYELGAAGKEVMDTTLSDNSGQWTNNGEGYIPTSPMSSTHRSFMVCASFTPAASNSDNATRNIKVLALNRQTSSPYPGWEWFMPNEDSGWPAPYRLLFRLHFGATGSNTLYGPASLVMTPDIPVFACVVVDFAVSKIMMFMAQGPNTAYSETAITFSGSFLQTSRMQIATHTGLGGAYGAIQGKVALINTFEWDASIPSGVTIDNVKRYLKYTDGVLA
jgi:hypothetical protein